MKNERRLFLKSAVALGAVGLVACAEQAGVPKESTVGKTTISKNTPTAVAIENTAPAVTNVPPTGVREQTPVPATMRVPEQTDVPVGTEKPTANNDSTSTPVDAEPPLKPEVEKGPVPVMNAEQVILGDRVIRVEIVADPARVSKADVSNMRDPQSRMLMETMQIGATALADVTRAEYLLAEGIASRPDTVRAITDSFAMAVSYTKEVSIMNQRGVAAQDEVATPTPNPLNSEFGWTRGEFGIPSSDKNDWEIVKDGGFITDGRLTVRVSIMKSPTADKETRMKEGNPIETYLGQVATIIGTVVTEIDITDRPLTEMGQNALSGLTGYLRDVSTHANSINYEATPTPMNG